ncbi:C6 transcription factor (War1), putative [Talaromyces stipitatus ATCC 10500]|uniref:C6 transcription factor (War1), putative n=1 Tax=Talaromyces stipitatus (strain ATCC 10500 / CBS 375.48 / QM 6759 / NRRL 1006) TaxID=441959 RepID=B8M670_TALSN|nr:C6 transcription factor (War1), putative [Talaromyces stipitatus ATCC 10500]EED19070.1 C6 transcription factor (War1), putative [Talaromyces stipitatus ATCC 10500]
MDIDPRLRPSNDNLKENNNNISFPDRDSYSNPRHHPPSYAPNQALEYGARLDHGRGYGQVTSESPSAHPQQSTSTPSSTDNRVAEIGSGSIAGYLNEMSMGASHDEHDPNDPLADLKRPRACEACRQLKVRCEQDNNHPSGSCKRCAKANRKCIVTAPTRKRQKKTDSRVSELEKKIDALTASLQASRRIETMASPEGRSQDQELAAARRWLGGGPRPPSLPPLAKSISPSTSTKRTASGEFKYSAPPGSVSQSSTFIAPVSPREVSEVLTLTFQQAPSANLPSESVINNANEFTDVIDRGLIDVQTAVDIFNHYMDEIAPRLPVVVFPPGTTMASVRRNKPTLFLVIMAISIGHFRSELQMSLVHEVHRLFADKVVIKGERSLELVQSIMLACIWYVPPDQFEELKFFQFIYMAVVMSLDIGMGRVTRKKGNKPHGLLREIMGNSSTRPSFDPDSVETRRVWLGAYFMAVNASMALRRPLLCRWHPYMDECIEILQTSPEAQPSDRNLIYWAKLTRIAEEIGFQFSMDDPSSSLSMSDTKVQYALKGFERQLDEWRREIPRDEYTPILRQAESIINIYMHEISMHTEHNIEDLSNPFTSAFKTDVKFDKATAAQIDALTACLTSIHTSLDCMLSIEPEVLVTLPTHMYARSAYAFIALLKMFSGVSSNHGLGHVFSPADLKVEEYFDKMIDHLKISSMRPGGRTASRFCMVLNLLKNWFLNRKGEASGSKNEESTSARPKEENDDSQGPSRTATNVSSAHQRSMLATTDPGDKKLPSVTSTTSDPQQWANYSVSGPETTTSSSFLPEQYQFNQNLRQDVANPMMNNGLLPGSQAEYANLAPDFDFQIPFNAEGIFSMGGGMLPDNVFDLPFDENMNFYLQ